MPLSRLIQETRAELNGEETALISHIWHPRAATAAATTAAAGGTTAVSAEP